MNPHKVAADALWPDVQDWILTHHKKELENLYSRLFGSYLVERFGSLTPEAKKAMIKTLMKHIME